MKLSLRPTTIGTIVLLTTLSTVLGTGIQYQVQAQTNIHEYQSTPGPICKGDISGYPKEFASPDGKSAVFYELAGLEFTPKQQKVFDKAIKKVSAEFAKAPMTKLPFNPDGLITVSTKGRSKVSEALLREKYDAASAANADQISNAKQIRELNEKYGKNAKFVYEEVFAVAPSEVQKRRSAVREYEETMLSVFDSAQKKVFLRNLQVKRDIESCAPDNGGSFPIQLKRSN